MSRHAGLRALPLVAMALLLSGCGPKRQEIGIAVLVTLPFAWLAYGILRRALGMLFDPWSVDDWRPWLAGTAASLVVAVTGFATSGLHRFFDLSLLALVTAVPSTVAFSLLFWRLLRPFGQQAFWVAPAIVSGFTALFGTMLRLNMRFEDELFIFWVVTGYAWVGPGLVLAILAIEALVRRRRASSA